MTWLACGRRLCFLPTCRFDFKNYILLTSQNSRVSRAMASSDLVQQTLPEHRTWSARFDLTKVSSCDFGIVNGYCYD